MVIQLDILDEIQVRGTDGILYRIYVDHTGETQFQRVIELTRTEI